MALKLWKTLSSKIVFDTRWTKIRQDTVELPNGTIIDDYFVRVFGEYSLMVPYTAEGKFILVRQYKHGAADFVTEFPAGFLNEGETPEAAAIRELREETGYAVANLEKLGEFQFSPTKDISCGHFYLATGLTEGVTDFDPGEDIETFHVSPGELWQMIRSGEIHISDSVAAALLALDKLNLLEVKA